VATGSLEQKVFKPTPADQPIGDRVAFFFPRKHVHVSKKSKLYIFGGRASELHFLDQLYKKH